MKKLIRPKNVQKSQRGYLTNEQYQDYAEQQFNNIYEYIDEDILFDDDTNTKTTINLPNLTPYDSLEIWYRTERIYEIRGSQKVQNPIGMCLNINILFRDTSTTQKGATSLWKINQDNITLVSGSSYEINHNTSPIMNTSNNTFITRIIGIKK